MANILTEVTPKLLAQGLLALREVAVMPQLVNRRYEIIAGQKGSTIDVPIPSAVSVQDVTPANTPPNTGDVQPTSVPIPLNSWKEAPFYLTDKDMLEAMDGFIPMEASEAIKGIANQVNSDILALGRKFYGFAGTAGTTPFGNTDVAKNGDTADATTLRKILNKQLANISDRHVVFDPDAEANALNLRAFNDANWSGTVEAIMNGNLNSRLGFRWWMHQLVPTFVGGTLSDGTNKKALVNGALAQGVKTMNIDSTTLTGTLVDGDVFTIAGQTQTYVVSNTTLLTAAGNAITGVTFEPALKVAVADNAQITFKADHVMNIGFHRDAIAFATRPLDNVQQGLGSITSSAVDPDSGLSLRLEVTREHKRTRFSYDILYGVAVVRREFGARLAG